MRGGAAGSGSGARPGRSRAPLAAVLTLVILLGVVTATAISIRRAAHQDAEARFTQSATQTRSSIDRQVRTYFDKLGDVGAYVANDAGASQESFAGFVRGTSIFDQLPSLVGVFYVARVEDKDLPAFLEQTRQGTPDFSPKNIGVRPPDTPNYLLTYYEAGEVDLALPIGTEISPITSVSDLMGKSVQSGDGVVGSFQDDPTLQEIARLTDFPLIRAMLELDFFIGMPVYEDTPEGAPRGAPIGFVGATVANFEEVASSATSGQPEDLGLSLSVDLTDVGMGARSDLSRAAVQEGGAGPRDQAAFTVSQPFEVNGVEWRVDVWSTADADAVPVSVPIVFVGGVLLSVLAALLLSLRIRARDRERVFAAELADREHFQRDILGSVTNAMVVLDADGRIVHSNAAWTQLHTLARPADEGAAIDAGHDQDSGDGSDDRDEQDGDDGGGRRYLDLLSPSVRAGTEELAESLDEVLSGATEVVELDIPIDEGARHRWYSVRATPLRGRHGGAVVVHTDITERKRSHDELAMKAMHDALTGLLNRHAFESEVDKALTAARLEEAHVAVVFIDLDGFKPINDTYGHAVGDDVLRAVAQRITSAVRTSDRTARLGGDEFVVLISPLPDPAIAEATAARILQALSQPVHVGGRQIALAASIGVAVVDSPLGSSHDALIERADRAMYQSKQQGGSRATISP